MKKLISTVLAAALTLSLAACGSTAASSTPEAASGSEAASTASSETASDASDAIDFTGDGYDAAVDYASLAGTTIKVAASPVPHAEILKVAGDILAKADITLDVVEYTDYVQPNLVTESGEVDANYFQHIPYLDSFNEEKGTHLVNAGGIHYEPFGIYPGTKKDLKDIAKGDKIAVPNDTTNEARALLLLQDNGIIKLKEGAGIKATVNDIEENPNNIEIVELEAAQVPRVVNEVAYVVLNGNYALEANYTVKKDALAYEKSDSEAAKTYVNVIAVKEGNENSKKIKALVDVLKSDSIKKFINEKYDGAVIVYDGE